MVNRRWTAESKNKQVLLFVFSHSSMNSYSGFHQSTQLHSSEGRRKRDERQQERERASEQERDRKQSQRYCDTQGFLVSFWNLMNQTWSLHTHAHTHTHTLAQPYLSWLHGPIHAMMAYREKLLKPAFTFLPPLNLDISGVQSRLVNIALFQKNVRLYRSDFVPLKLQKYSSHPCIR